MPPCIALIGANGYLGRAIAQRLAALSIPHRLISRGPASIVSQNAITGIDAANPAALAPALANATAVIDATASPNPARIASSIAASAHFAARVIQLSSIAVYANGTGDLDETAPRRAAGRQGYAARKAAAEDALRLTCPARTSLLRLGAVITGSPTDDPAPRWERDLAALLATGQLGLLPPWANGWIPLIPRHLAAAAIVDEALNRRPGMRVRNLVATPLRSNAYLTELAARHGLPAPSPMGAAHLACALAALARRAMPGATRAPCLTPGWLTDLSRPGRITSLTPIPTEGAPESAPRAPATSLAA